MSAMFCFVPDSYSDDTDNMLLKSNHMDSAEMTHQIGSKSRAKKWKVVRSYTSKFSCIEAVERLIKIHSDTKEA